MQPVPDDIGYWENFAVGQQAGGRDDCVPHFYMRAVRNAARSEAEGRPVFDEAPYVKVLVPGDRNSVVDRRVGDADRERWPGQWAAFQAKRARPAGTPIGHWPYLTVARAAELKALELLTVEQVAAADDALAERIGGDAAALIERARQFLQPQSETETELRQEIDRLKRRVADLERERAKPRPAEPRKRGHRR